RTIAVEHDREIAAPRRFANRPDEFRVTVIDKQGISGAHDALRIARRGGGDTLIPISNDRAVAARIHEDRGERRTQSVDALAGSASALPARNALEHPAPIPTTARGPAHRPRQRSATAEASDRNRGVRGAAAIDYKKALGLHLAVWL